MIPSLVLASINAKNLISTPVSKKELSILTESTVAIPSIERVQFCSFSLRFRG